MMIKLASYNAEETDYSWGLLLMKSLFQSLFSSFISVLIVLICP